MNEELPAHRLAFAGLMSSGGYVVRCHCGRLWERSRLADGAIALERHEVTEAALYVERKQARERISREAWS